MNKDKVIFDKEIKIDVQNEYFESLMKQLDILNIDDDEYVYIQLNIPFATNHLCFSISKSKNKKDLMDNFKNLTQFMLFVPINAK